MLNWIIWNRTVFYIKTVFKTLFKTEFKTVFKTELLHITAWIVWTRDVFDN